MPTIQSVNPYNEELNGEFELLNDNQINEKIEIAHSAYLKWKDVSFDEKKALFHKFADVVEANIDEFARLQTIEMGMLFSASKAGMQWTIALARWFADNAEKILWDEEFDYGNVKWKFQHKGLGVIYWVAPWNFPYNQVLRAAIPNILAGNTQVYKHASNVPMCGAQIEKFFIKAGFPEGIYQNMYISSSKSEMIMEHPHVRGLNLTGGERAGRVLGGLAGKNLKPSVLELGWNDAFIVADHDDMDKVVDIALAWRMRNGWQTCTGSKRFIVPAKYYDEFCERFTKAMAEQKMWDPMDESVQVQPLCQASAADEVDRQVQQSIADGAKLLTGWKKTWVNGKWFFYEPTVLADVTPDIYSFHEEIFGPVASVIKANDIDHAIELANAIELGLGWVIAGDDREQMKYIAERMDTGMVYFNKPAASMPSIPFGWVKKSGYWKENGPEGLKAFTNKKVIVY